MTVSLDETDRRLLRLLQQDASLSSAELAERVGLSQAPCWRRVKRLKDEGVVEAVVALADPRKLGLGVTVMATVTLEHHSEQATQAFERAVLAAPEVLDCARVTGDRDYWLRIVVADIEDYDRFLTERLLHLKLVRSVNSRFVLKQLKRSTALPV